MPVPRQVALVTQLDAAEEVRGQPDPQRGALHTQRPSQVLAAGAQLLDAPIPGDTHKDCLVLPAARLARPRPRHAVPPSQVHRAIRLGLPRVLQHLLKVVPAPHPVYSTRRGTRLGKPLDHRPTLCLRTRRCRCR
jgi:hypothetical protein